MNKILKFGNFPKPKKALKKASQKSIINNTYAVTIYSTKDKLPPFGKYVLCHHTRGTWRADDQFGCEWVVLCRIEQSDGGDVNYPDYYWDEFGPDSFDADDIDMWCDLPFRSDDGIILSTA